MSGPQNAVAGGYRSFLSRFRPTKTNQKNKKVCVKAREGDVFKIISKQSKDSPVAEPPAVYTVVGGKLKKKKQHRSKPMLAISQNHLYEEIASASDGNVLGPGGSSERNKFYRALVTTFEKEAADYGDVDEEDARRLATDQKSYLFKLAHKLGLTRKIKNGEEFVDFLDTNAISLVYKALDRVQKGKTDHYGQAIPSNLEPQARGRRSAKELGYGQARSRPHIPYEYSYGRVASSSNK